MRVLIIYILFSSVGFSQTISYNPGMTVESTVESNYYNTEYIFISNIGTGSLNLEFELVQEDIPADWAASGCTNVICYTGVPEYGTLGNLANGEEAYVSINLSVNGVAGDAIIRYRIFDYDNHEMSDTIAFIYHVESDTINSTPQPWAKINFYQNVLTVFLKNEFEGSVLSVYDICGRQVVRQEAETITAISFEGFEAGVYIVSIENNQGQRMTQRVFNGQ